MSTVKKRNAKKSETVTKQPVEEVVEVGTKKAAVVTTQELTVTEPILMENRP